MKVDGFFSKPHGISASEVVVGEIRLATTSDFTSIRRVVDIHYCELGAVSDRAILRAIIRGTVMYHPRSEGFCRAHRLAGITRVSEICIPADYRGQGIARGFLSLLKTPILLKCRVENMANEFYFHLGFQLVGSEVLKKWTQNVWRYEA